MQEPTTAPEPAVEGHANRVTDDSGNTTVNITVTASDPEMQAMEAVLVTLQMLTYDSRVRILRYVAERVGTDPEVWGQPALSIPDAAKLTHAEVAQVLAEADGHDWAVMSDVQQSPYYRRAAALTAPAFAVVRLDS